MSQTSISYSARTIIAALCVSACTDAASRLVQPTAPSADAVKFWEALATTRWNERAATLLQQDPPTANGQAQAATSRTLTYLSLAQYRAVLAAEDSAFFEHEGIDVAEIKKSIQVSIEKGESLRGASTITQQLAKNLYLSPSRDPLRKVRELMITWRLEAALPKARIFEIYLNVIEWGDLVWGAEAAARTYFGVPASALSREQSALLAGAIINPRVYSPANPRARLVRRQQIILARMPGYEPPAPVPVVVPAVEPEASEAPQTPTEEPSSPTVIEDDEPAREPAPPPQPSEPPV